MDAKLASIKKSVEVENDINDNHKSKVITMLCPTRWTVMLCPTIWAVVLCPTRWAVMLCPTRWTVMLCPTRWAVVLCPTGTTVWVKAHSSFIDNYEI